MQGTFPIVEGVVTTTIYGKGVAVAGMKTSCGAMLIPSQFTDIIEFAGASSARAAGSPQYSSSVEVGSLASPGTEAALTGGSGINNGLGQEKSIKRIYWSYGSDEIPVESVSRHYIDLNLHVETENYAAGESVEIVLSNDDGTDLMTGVRQLRLHARVRGDNSACIRNVFKDKTVELGVIS